MAKEWKWAIGLGWLVTALLLGYLVWGHLRQKSWARAMTQATVSGHHAQEVDLRQLGLRVSALDGLPWVPAVPTPGDWPPPDPPEFP